MSVAGYDGSPPLIAPRRGTLYAEGDSARVRSRMQHSPSERRRAGQAPATQALLAELTILRHGLGTVRDAATEWLPGMVGLLLRLTDLARDGALRAEDANAALVRPPKRLPRALEGPHPRVPEVAPLPPAAPLPGPLTRPPLPAPLARAVAHAEAADEP